MLLFAFIVAAGVSPAATPEAPATISPPALDRAIQEVVANIESSLVSQKLAGMTRFWIGQSKGKLDRSFLNLSLPAGEIAEVPIDILKAAQRQDVATRRRPDGRG